jgi:hypothetical protein
MSRVFSRYGCLGVPRRPRAPAASRQQAPARAYMGLERGLRLGRGSLHHRRGTRRVLGLERFRQRVKIYATAHTLIQEVTLDQARATALFRIF